MLNKSLVQRIPPPRPGVPPFLKLKDFVPQEISDAIAAAGKIVFHTVGDTGAAKVDARHLDSTAIAQEAAVADAMAADVQSGGLEGSAFFFHLGDVIYNFGKAQYYYDQFYEPYREYDRPIFAIPGNHDGMVFGSGSSAPQVPSLEAFLANFVAPAAGSLARRRRDGPQRDDAARGLLHARCSLRFDHRPVQQCKGYRRRRYFLAGRALPAGG